MAGCPQRKEERKDRVVMKLSIWDILTGILLLAILLVGGLVMSVFANPYSSFNPFPPQKLPPTVVIPSSTPTFRSMPATWTPNAETEQAYAALGYTLVPSETAGPSPTGFTLTFTDTPTDTETPTDTATLTPWASSTTYVYVGPSATSCSWCTATPVPSTRTATNMPNIVSASEASGVKNNVWQNKTNNPVFYLNGIQPNMIGFYYYFGLDPNGTNPVPPPVGEGTDTPTATSTNTPPTNYIPIQHDGKPIDFTPPPVPGCGAYYLRIQTNWAFKGTSSWSTVFTFKYDNTPPIPIFFAPSGITGALRGIQNISASPHFNWGNWNGDILPADVIPSGDYRAYGPNSDGVPENQLYKCSGVKGYNVYFGQSATGTSPYKYITSTSYSPPPVTPNTPYYLRIQSIDLLNNTSDWSNVLLDDDSSASLLERVIFLYDNTKPNNLLPSDITEWNYGDTNDSGFTNHTHPDFHFTGGDDPGGFKPIPWGYDVVWNTDQKSTASTFLPGPAITGSMDTSFSPLISKSGTYYLKVRAVDWALNRSAEWAQFVYQVDNLGPTGVSKVTELTGAPNKVFQNTLFNPSFTWDASLVKDPGDVTTSSGLVPGFYIYWGTDPVGGFSPPSQLENTFVPVAVSDGIYYLRIMVMDVAGNQTVTTPFILKYDGTPPTTPAVTEHDITPTHKTFRWASNDATSGIAGYAYYWGTDSGGTSNKFSKTPPNPLDGGIHAIGSKYYLWVQAKDNAGNLSTPYQQEFDY
jgi:hypothetical protein